MTDVDLQRDIEAFRAQGPPTGWFDTPSIRRREFMEELAARDLGWKCFYCFKEISNELHSWHPRKAVIEHVVPRLHGGTDDLKNLVLACKRCNGRKGSKLVDEFLNPAQPIFPCWRSWKPIIERWEAAAV